MKKARRRALLAAAFLLTGTIAAGVLYIHSETFREAMQARLTSALAQQTDSDCRIGRLDFDPWRLRFSLEGLRLQPRKGKEGAFRLEVARVEAVVRPISLLRRRVHLSELRITRPRIRLAGGEGGSGWNPGAVLKTVRISLDIAAGRLDLIEGWFELGNRRIPLDFSLDELDCRMHFAAAPPRYLVRLSYRNGRVQWAGRDIRHDLHVRGELSMEGFAIESLGVRRDRSILMGSGRFRDWAHPTLELRTTSTVAGQDLTLFHESLADARGALQATAEIHWDGAGFRAAGSFSAANASYRQVEVDALTGSYGILEDVLELRGFEAHVGDGALAGSGLIQLRRGNAVPHSLELRASRFRLRDAAGAVGYRALDLENSVDASVRLRWLRGARDLDVEGEARLLGLENPAAGERATALEGPIGFRYRNGTWFIPAARLSSADTTVSVEGENSTRFHVSIRTTNVAEPVELMRTFVPSADRALAEDPSLTALHGTIEAEGWVSLAIPDEPEFEGKLRATAIRWRDHRADEIQASVHLRGNRLFLSSATARRGRESLKGALSVEFSEGTGPALSFRGEVANVALRSIRQLGVNVTQDLEGEVSGSGYVTVRRDVWRGAGRLTAEQLRFRDETIDVFSGQVRLESSVAELSGLLLRRGNVAVRAEGQVELDTRALDLRVRLEDSSLLEISALRGQAMPVEGRLSGEGKISGTWESPAFDGRLELDRLRYEGWNLGRGTATIGLREGKLSVRGSVRSELGAFTVESEVSTEPGYPGSAELDFHDWNAQRLLSGNTPDYLGGISTALQGKVELAGRFADLPSLSGRGEMDGARVSIGDYDFRNEDKIRFVIADRRIRLEDVQISGDETSLKLNGTLPLDPNLTLDLRLAGKLNLKIVEAFDKRVRATGSAGIDVRASGTYTQPEFIGRASLAGARVESSVLPSSVSDLIGDLVFFRNSVRLENVRGVFAGGTVEGSGYVEYEQSALRALNLQFLTRGSRLPFPPDFRSVFDADLALRGSLNAPVLSGRVRLTRCEFVKEFNLLEQLAAGGIASQGALSEDPFLGRLRLNVQVESDGGIVVDNELARLQGDLRLAVRGTPAFPVLAGRVSMGEGSLFFRGNRFDLSRGYIDFADRNRINPTLDIRAEADVKSYRLLLEVRGQLDRLQFNLTSDPPMSTVEIVSLLTTGRSRESDATGARREAEITGLSAASILSEELTGVIGRRVKRIFGLDSVRVDPFLAGAENDPTARVTVNQRISRDLSVVFSRNLSTNEEQIMVVEYDVTRNVSVVATRDEDGKYGLDFRIRKRFR